MKTSVLIALGLVASVSANRHKHHHQQRHAKKVTTQQLQQEIEQLKEQYNNLEADYEQLAKQTSTVQQSLAQSPFGTAGPNGKGPAYPSPQPFVRGEKQWMDNAQNIGDWGDQQMTVANTRIPYQSTAQLEGPAPFGIATEAGHLGGPAYPSPQPFVRGEKQWMDNAQNIGDWGDNQMTIANTRIPYQSTLTQIEGPAPFGIATEAGHLGGPAYPSPQPFVRGEKQWMDNAQNIEDWGIHQMEVANTRIPYQSTLTQLESEGPALYGIATQEGHLGGPAYPSPQPFVRGEKQWMDNAQNIEDWGIHQMEVANTRIPYQSTLVQLNSEGPAPFGIATDKAQLGGPAYPSPQPFVRGEKQWMDNAQNIEDWGIHQMEMANTRIPYASTLLQLNDEKDTEDSTKEETKKPAPKEAPKADEPDESILYEKEVKSDKPEKVMTLSTVPMNTELVQQDNDPSKIEGFLMEDPNIPLNLRLVQTKQDDDPNNMESMVMDELDIPRNMRLLHVKTHAGDELIKIVN